MINFTKVNNTIDIIINEDIPTLPAASKALIGQQDFLLNALVSLGLDPVSTPLATLLKPYYQLTGNCLILSPIHCQATQDDAMIIASGKELALSPASARIWFEEIKQFLSEDGFTLVYHDPYHWLVDVGDKPLPFAKNIQLMSQQSLKSALHSMDPSLYWQKLFTELQMFMSSHPLNTAQNIKFPLNGVWFWGGGDLSTLSEKPLMSDEPRIKSYYSSCQAIDLNSALPDNLILILNQFDESMMPHLQQITRKKRVSWHWNNISYETSAKSWWSKLLNR